MQQENTINVKEYVENLNIFKKKLPKRDLTKDVKLKVKTVNTLEEDTRNGGWVTDDKGCYILKKITTIDNEKSVSVVMSDGKVLEGVEIVEPELEKKEGENEDDGEIKNSKLILTENLAIISKGYSDRIINYLKDNHISEWVSKTQCITNITETKKEARIINNTSWKWHSDENMYKLVSEIKNGLLFKMEDNIWYVRYN